MSSAIYCGRSWRGASVIVFAMANAQCSRLVRLRWGMNHERALDYQESVTAGDLPSSAVGASLVLSRR
jgi:hypothetical protein